MGLVVEVVEVVEVGGGDSWGWWLIQLRWLELVVESKGGWGRWYLDQNKREWW